MKKRKFIVLLILFSVVAIAPAKASNKEAETVDNSSLEVSVKFLNKHLWRGQLSGNTGSIEPDITWKINSNWALSMWGGYCFDGSYQELDLYVTCSWKQFSFTLFDYYNPPSGSTFFSKQITTFDNSKTLHLFDLKGSYQFQTIPVLISASTLLYGDDKTTAGKQRFSTYIEAVYSYKCNWGEFNFLTGITPHKSLYASKARVVNLEASANAPVKLHPSLKTNLSTSMTYNPIRKESYFRIGLQVQL